MRKKHRVKLEDKEYVVTGPGCRTSYLSSLLTGNMVPKLLGSRLWFLLLLGFVRMSVSFEDPPGDLTPAQWFEIQHINMAGPKCDDAMQIVNSYIGQCKAKNTFLKATFADVVQVCGTPNVTCLTSPSTNCHKSSVQVPLTICSITKSKLSYGNCKYTDVSAMEFYVVACDKRSPRDNTTYPVVPVHLDGTY
nr:ribonuclease 2B-like [Marmota flaviventris]